MKLPKNFNALICRQFQDAHFTHLNDNQKGQKCFLMKVSVRVWQLKRTYKQFQQFQQRN